jgi:hypothetical protein
MSLERADAGSNAVWQAKTSIREQFSSRTGIGLIVRTLDPVVLKEQIIKATPGMDLVHSAIPLAEEEHEGQSRKYEDVPYVIHPLQVTLWDALNNSGVTDVELAIDVLHDTVEDCGTTKSKVRSALSKGNNRKEVELVWSGINAMSSRKGGKKMKPSEYHSRLEHSHHYAEEIHIFQRKLADRGMNLGQDIAAGVDTLGTQTFPDAADRIESYIDKAAIALRYGRQYEPNAPHTQLVIEELRLARDLIETNWFHSPWANVRP